jgi:hypothetical protein
VDALADGRMKFQAVSVYEDALRRNVGEIGARQQAAARIVHLVLLHRFRQPSGYRSEKSKLQRRFAAFLASLIPLWSSPLDGGAVETSNMQWQTTAAAKAKDKIE